MNDFDFNKVKYVNEIKIYITTLIRNSDPSSAHRSNVFFPVFMKDFDFNKVKYVEKNLNFYITTLIQILI